VRSENYLEFSRCVVKILKKEEYKNNFCDLDVFPEEINNEILEKGFLAEH